MTQEDSRAADGAPESTSPSGKFWIAGFAIPGLIVLAWTLLPARETLINKWSMLSATSFVVFGACIIAAVTDIRYQRIFNWITYPAALWCLVLSALGSWTDFGARLSLSAIPFSDSLLGFFALFFLLAVVFSVSGGGAGDVKLTAVIGSGLGMANGLTVLAYTFIVAAVGGLCWMIWLRGPIPVFQYFMKWIGCLLMKWRVERPTEEEREKFRLMVVLAPWFAIGCAMVLFRESFAKFLTI